MGLHPLKATCSCGFEAKGIAYGCTMIMCAKNINYRPAFCNTCGEIICVNEKTIPITCSKCYSMDILLYGTPKMLGEEIEVDLSSETFYKRYESYNEYLEMVAETDGKNFVPMSIDKYKIKSIKQHKENVENAESPIFSHYNYCPKCTEYRLKFNKANFGLHID